MDAAGPRGEDNRTDGKAHGQAEEGPQRPKGRPGRRPGGNPQGRIAAKRLISWVGKFRDRINGFFRSASSRQSEDGTIYDNTTKLWTVVLGLLTRRTSRNKMDCDRNDEEYAKNVFKMSGQTWWLDGERKTVPSSETWCRLLSMAKTSRLQMLLIRFARALIAEKLFEAARLCGRLVVSVDGTKVESKRGCPLKGSKKNRYALEVKILTPWGWAVTILVEPVKAYDPKNKKQKQDCEYAAFRRVEKRLKKWFGRYGLVIVADALYCCSPVIEMCRENDWRFIFTFKEGRTPDAYAEAQSLMALDEDGHGPMTRKVKGGLRETIGSLRWATGVKLGNSVVNVVECHQEKPAEEAYYGQFATDLDVGKAAYAQKVAEWGRRRWTIENSFKTQKSKGEDGFGLEHTFCNDENASRAMHLLMQFAHNLWQVFNSGMLRKLAKGCRKVTQSIWARKLCEALHNIDFSDYEPETVYLSREYELEYLTE
ncbi:MAG: transposase [Kiritimatiellae bacterium]|nr:transposase [Kiritimatiellia bacterium]